MTTREARAKAKAAANAGSFAALKDDNEKRTVSKS
jgi:hypothetical protein